MDLTLEFTRYNGLMNQQLLEACRDLDPGQLATSVPGTYGAVGATWVHVANSQESYAAGVSGARDQEPLEPDPFPGFDRLADHLATSQARIEAAAAAAADDSTRIEVSGDDPPGTWSLRRSLLLIQVVVHGVEHRSQIATILTQLGIEPPDMEAWTFFFAAGHSVEV